VSHLAILRVVLALALAFMLSRPTALADVATPLAAVKSAIDETVAILHDQRTPLEQRRRELRQLAERNLDLARMAQASLGTHSSELTPAQRQEFVPLFAAFIEAAYLDQIQDYAKLKIDVSGETFIGGDHARVGATVLQPGEEPIHLEFMLERAGDAWIVYDVLVEDIGMVENYRAQFDRVIRSDGIGQLMNRLKLKQAQLASMLGQPVSRGNKP
jgi:phospholipid transport system substrate-binding protein